MVRSALGCKMCAKGAKMVLFVTGLCNKRCFYCPLSEKKRRKDVVYANERFVEKDGDILEEAHRMNALGTGVTGGEPLLFLGRTLHFMDLLKNEFGEKHHIHLYTTEKLNREVAQKLRSHGLDEIRFHIIGRPVNYKKSIENTKDAGMSTGVELPAIPGREKEIVDVIEKLEIDFLNLNEFEFSETNRDALTKRGFDTDNGIWANGSRELARKIVRTYGKKVPINFCSSTFKDGVQLRNRLIRTAENVAKDYECITNDGTIVRGIIETETEIPKIEKILRGNYKIEGKRILIEPDVLRAIAKDLPEGSSAYISEVYPTWDALEVEREILNTS